MSTITRATDHLPPPAIGGLAGIGATATMSGFMLLSRQFGLMSRLPPLEMTSKSIHRTGLRDDVEPEDREDLGWIAHYAFGAVGGALFAAAHRRLRLPGPTAGQGIVFGLLVWLVSYMGWIPALRLLPIATDDQPGRPTAMILAHAIYGASLGVAAGALDRDAG